MDKQKKNKMPKNKSRQSRSTSGDQIRAAIDHGIDISMLIQNISRSYTERIIRHQIALNTIEKLHKAGNL
jgi:hypothetical protein